MAQRHPGTLCVRGVFMRRMSRAIFPVLLCGNILSALPAGAQHQPAPQNQSSSSKPPIQKHHKSTVSKLAKESAPYTAWLTEEVPYIITKEERDAFLRLTTNEEREQ